ncbi:MAG: phytanoyl-CoA dioxygenase family protein [Alphaproteobacteria bacterium]|nr:phytanoyl-CoA dioxygenase family protein [Alphaproteobacteria bacterium]MBU0804978.1 phytanoyl-CoA dioxygenase family protein [Alphaproteobacteria bacterium]MBU0870477.1 phytanoyl-CoA dioxygenase family protein [Alphaproteobacteria bacterium]MBU1401848.1 phytanoyl-CoA dioxygenase family protein [Alphaproteobacteria bacterium]MBU1591735.1 phytanoyl-CoA dioxygenase family protein [Alphaproteobacteria bacterium]
MQVTQLDRDLYCLATAGFLVIPDFLAEPIVNAIEESAVAFELEVEAFAAAGGKVALRHSWPLRTTRCLFAVSLEIQDFVMNDYLQSVARAYLKRPILRDCLLQTVMPDGRNAGRGANGDLSIHRDTMWDEDQADPYYLHAFLVLDDFTAYNGATVVVPGTHRAREPGYYFKHSDPRRPQSGIDYAVYEKRYFPSAIQLKAQRGSLILLDPMVIHSQGNNVTNAPRRLVNATFRNSMCRPRPALLNARRIAALHSRVPVRPDLLLMLEDDPSLPSVFGPLGAEPLMCG